MNKILSILLLAVIMLSPDILFSTLFPGERVYYYAEYYQKCSVVFDRADWFINPYNEVSVWCGDNLVLRDQLLEGDAIPEVQGEVWPRIAWLYWGAVTVSSSTKTERFVMFLPLEVYE